MDNPEKKDCGCGCKKGLCRFKPFIIGGALLLVAYFLYTKMSKGE